MRTFSFRARREPLWKDLVAGAAAGAAGAWVMTPAAMALGKVLPKPAKKPSGGGSQEPSTEKLARRVLGAFGVSLSKKQKAIAGQLVHYGYGATLGALYGALWPRVNWVGKLFGLGYGAALFVASDEGMVTALKLAPSPKTFPWTVHAKALASHLAYGLTADTGFKVLRRAAIV